MRRAGPAELEAALTAGRHQLLTLFDGVERALGPDGLRIEFDPVLNLPLWELGHIGWFEEHWISRNPCRAQGTACDPNAARGASVLARADALYDSSNVPHGERWRLDLPSPDATRDYLAQVRESTGQHLRHSAPTDAELYFFRLVLFHEDMHREAWQFMAQQLGIDIASASASAARAPRASNAQGEWHIPAGIRQLGSSGAGFAFDNELEGGERLVDAFAIDRAPVSWRQFLPFVESGAYLDEALWSVAGKAWRSQSDRRHPRHLRRGPDGWEQHRFGRWTPIDLDAPAVHLSAHEARAWCLWAGRRLPTEAEWETAALLADGGTDDADADAVADADHPDDDVKDDLSRNSARDSAGDDALAGPEAFDWGEVWEWTATPFGPYAGFVPHPYRDYSQPWFDGRPVLRGASFATTPHMKHARYRNFFPAERDDVFAGFRSCAPARGRS